MKKGYVIFENGLMFNCELDLSEENILGALKKNQNSFCIQSLKDEKTVSFKVQDMQFENIKEGTLGKIVIDELPIDYHLYDLKTTI